MTNHQLDRRSFNRAIGYMLGAAVVPGAKVAAPIDLMPFCNRESTRFDLDRPFSSNGWTYAADGCIAVRVAHVSPSPTKADRVPNLSFLPFGDIHGWRPWPEQRWWTEIGDVDWCPYCEGLGFVGADVVRCDQCGGDGRCWDDEWDVSSVLCSKCRGRRCRGGDRCEYCAGKGQGELPTIQLVGSTAVSALYDLKIRRLPNVEFGQTAFIPRRAGGEPMHDAQPTPAVVFRFDGGDGVVMPREVRGRLQ